MSSSSSSYYSSSYYSYYFFASSNPTNKPTPQPTTNESRADDEMYDDQYINPWNYHLQSVGLSAFKPWKSTILTDMQLHCGWKKLGKANRKSLDQFFLDMGTTCARGGA